MPNSVSSSRMRVAPSSFHFVGLGRRAVRSSRRARRRSGPTTCSSTSSTVSSPAIVPNSSTTMAMCDRPSRNSSSIWDSGLVSGTTRCGRSSRSMRNERLGRPVRIARRRSSQTGSRSL